MMIKNEYFKWGNAWYIPIKKNMEENVILFALQTKHFLLKPKWAGWYPKDCR